MRLKEGIRLAVCVCVGREGAREKERKGEGGGKRKGSGKGKRGSRGGKGDGKEGGSERPTAPGLDECDKYIESR